MTVPEELRYTPTHEWIRPGEGTVRSPEGVLVGGPRRAEGEESVRHGPTVAAHGRRDERVRGGRERLPRAVP